MKVIVIVDAYSTGRFLIPAFQSYGYTLIHIQSCFKVPKIFASTHEKVISNFVENIVFTTTEDVMQKLSNYNVKCVIPGTETGVKVADSISEKLGLYTNGTNLSDCRRNKFKMHERLANCHIASIPHFKSNNLSEIIAWVKSKESGFEANKNPIVLKPVSSAGTDNVTFCYTEEQIKSVFNKIISTINILGEENTEVLAQRYLKGDEYIINTVSHDGVHFIVDIWKMNRIYINNIPICDSEEYIPHTELVFKILSDYVKQVLVALEINFGAGHSEVMMTENGPILIEIAARLIGGIDPSAITELLGFNQISMLVESYLSPNRFLAIIKLPRMEPKKFAKNVFFISHHSGEMTSEFDPTIISTTTGYYNTYFGLHVGDMLEPTNSYANCPGFVYLICDNKADLQKGYLQVRERETLIYTQLTQENNEVARSRIRMS